MAKSGSALPILLGAGALLLLTMGGKKKSGGSASPRPDEPTPDPTETQPPRDGVTATPGRLPSTNGNGNGGITATPGQIQTLNQDELQQIVFGAGDVAGAEMIAYGESNRAQLGTLEPSDQGIQKVPANDADIQRIAQAVATVARERTAQAISQIQIASPNVVFEVLRPLYVTDMWTDPRILNNVNAEALPAVRARIGARLVQTLSTFLDR